MKKTCEAHANAKFQGLREHKAAETQGDVLVINVTLLKIHKSSHCCLCGRR